VTATPADALLSPPTPTPPILLLFPEGLLTLLFDDAFILKNIVAGDRLPKPLDGVLADGGGWADDADDGIGIEDCC
jgi:hypothetical protein